jgi:hypothetical protein
MRPAAYGRPVEPRDRLIAAWYSKPQDFTRGLSVLTFAANIS